jgi:catechol 2,3-dioxygenase-like lactoylglutathione lyase family enzyme
MADAPNLFRVTLQVSDLDEATDFYSKLLDTKGRRIHGGRHYFDCGPIIVALVDPTIGGGEARPIPDYVYFSVKDIEAVHSRARELGRLSNEKVHGESAGEIVTRPWGERSFYVEDPFGNGLCFVDERTIFTGR